MTNQIGYTLIEINCRAISHPAMPAGRDASATEV
jgi:hypothetical protein